mgnify:CR=1 FL=1
MKIYSEKQRELMRLWQKDELCRMNLLEGSVRSGKTWISLVLWALWVASMPASGNYAGIWELPYGGENAYIVAPELP